MNLFQKGNHLIQYGGHITCIILTKKKKNQTTCSLSLSLSTMSFSSIWNPMFHLDFPFFSYFFPLICYKISNHMLSLSLSLSPMSFSSIWNPIFHLDFLSFFPLFFSLDIELKLIWENFIVTLLFYFFKYGNK